MSDVQAGPTGSAAEADGSDPRPVFKGDWNSASGAEKGAHSEAVRQWKLRQGGDAQSRMAAGSKQPEPHGRSAPPADARNRQVLEAIRDDPNALPSDRIRATQTLLQAERGAEAQGDGQSDLVVLRDTLALLDPHERLAWLQGERVAGLGA